MQSTDRSLWLGFIHPFSLLMEEAFVSLCPFSDAIIL